MTAVDLLPEMEELGAVAAEKWVAAASAEATALHAFDAYLYPQRDDPALMSRAHGLHKAWKRWIDETGNLIARLKNDALMEEQTVPGLDELRYSHAVARGIVAMEPEEMLRRYQRYVSDEVKTYTLEEVRRELGLKSRR